MHKLTGYTDRWSVKQGAAIRFHVSSAGAAPFNLRFVRHTCPDPNPQGPGYAENAMASLIDGRHGGQEQAAWLGSFGHVPALAVPAGGLTVRAVIWPTTPAKGRQGIVAVRLGGWILALGIGAGGGAMLEVKGAGGTVAAEVARPLRERRWYDVVGTLAADGRLSVRQVPHAPLGDTGEAQASGAAPCPGGVASVFLAAMPPDGGGAPASGHYNGKLETPALWQGQGAAAPHPDVPHAGAPGLVAAWDFSRGIPTQMASEIGAQAAHARLVNLPTRAMTGASWTGSVHDWKTDPTQYGAIHFHDDDQGDLGWQESFALVVPQDWPSGFYAAHLRNATGEDYIPFFVRPAKPSADVAFLVPTFSYQVYGCFVRPGRGAEIAERAGAWGALTETPDMNPQFGLSCYNYHSDGSGVSLVSMRRPQLDTRPRQMALMDPVEGGSGTARIGADGYFIHWLASEGIAHDVITDHDLHEEGAAALAPYRVVIAGQHPEYHSERMMQALEDYLGDAGPQGGGRLMYLGGNGFYWRAEPSEFASHAMEVRRAESGIRVWATEPGESYNQFGGGYGGLWRRIGRSGHRLVGINFSSQGRHLGFPYHFTAGITDKRAGFMTTGLDIAEGAAFGDSGFMGGGAAGYELDSVNFKYGSPPHVLVVAKGVVVHEDYGWVNEDMLVHRHPLPQEEWSCADMTFFETPAGGAVFSAGSMTYAGSVAVPGTLRTLTTNVLRRFVDPAPFVLPE